MEKRILILANHFIALYIYRKELINKLIKEGYRVIISIPRAEESSYFTELGCEVINTEVNRRGMNPIKDLKLLFKYIGILKTYEPTAVISYTIKPNIYGSIACKIMKKKQICNITGTGAVFLKKNMLYFIAKQLYKHSVRNSHRVFFQNNGDRDFFINNKLVKNNWRMLPGSGVNLEQFKLCELTKDSELNFIFIGRVMFLKGIREYLECAKSMKQLNPKTSFYIAGYIEEEGCKELIEEYNMAGIIKYLGFQEDVRPFIENCSCVILPSLGGEGVPNALLEGAAMGRALIASRINGSCDVVEDGVNGFLFTPGHSEELIDKIQKFIDLDLEVKRQMGLMGRKRVEERFNRELVVNAYMEELEEIKYENLGQEIINIKANISG